MNVLISGYYGSRNGGDEAMLASMLEGLREFGGDIKVTVISLNPEYTKKRHNVDAIPTKDIFAIVKKILSADLVISGGGSLLQNVTSRRSLYYYLGIIFLAKFFGRKVMLYAQGIGPVYGFFPRKIMKLIVNRADLITVRDSGSPKELERLGIDKPKIFCTADPVLATKPVSTEVGKKILEKYSVVPEEKLVGVSVRLWADWKHCQTELAKAADEISARLGAKIIFIPMQFPEDVKAAKAVAALMKNNFVVIDEELSTSDVLSLIGCMNLVIGIRLHALIFSGVMNIPALGISYDPKIDRFLDSVGEKPVGTISDLTAEKIFDAAKKKLSAGKNSGNEEQMEKLRSLARKNSQLATELLKS